MGLTLARRDLFTCKKMTPSLLSPDSSVLLPYAALSFSLPGMWLLSVGQPFQGVHSRQPGDRTGALRVTAAKVTLEQLGAAGHKRLSPDHPTVGEVAGTIPQAIYGREGKPFLVSLSTSCGSRDTPFLVG